MKVVILGGGITGLAAAWFLKRKWKSQVDVTLLEKSNRIGGWIRTHHEGNFLFELGPRGFRPTGQGKLTLELIHELGLEGKLIAASKTARRRFIYWKGKLHPFSLPFLLRQGIVKGVIHDWF